MQRYRIPLEEYVELYSLGQRTEGLVRRVWGKGRGARNGGLGERVKGRMGEGRVLILIRGNPFNLRYQRSITCYLYQPKLK